MMNKIKILFFLTVCAAAFALSARAQTVGEGTLPAADSELAQINLPTGARRVKDGMAPGEITEVLRKLVAQGNEQTGEIVRQGASEVLLWGGDFRASKQARMIETLSGNLRRAGWNYEVAAKENGVTIFVLTREMPSLRALVGFFAPTDESFVCALTEMLPVRRSSFDGAAAKRTSESQEVTATDAATVSTSADDGRGKLVGKWTRSVGAGRGDDGTGKTTYESGSNYTFEFFADGTMRFLIETKVLSIMQCRTTETTKLPGTYSVRGGELTMNLGAGTSVGTSSCERAGNYKKTLSASTLVKNFAVKNLESVFRPDAPLILCFDGADGDACYEKSVPYNR